MRRAILCPASPRDDIPALSRPRGSLPIPRRSFLPASRPTLVARRQPSMSYLDKIASGRETADPAFEKNAPKTRLAPPWCPVTDAAPCTPRSHNGDFIANALHRESVVIDGLIISKWDRSVFEDMRRAGLTAPTARYRSGKADGGQHRRDEAADPPERGPADAGSRRATSAAPRPRADRHHPGFQNGHAFEDRLGNIEAFADMGVRVVQLCYNTQNLIGTGCHERDGGLSGYAAKSSPK